MSNPTLKKMLSSIVEEDKASAKTFLAIAIAEKIKSCINEGDSREYDLLTKLQKLITYIDVNSMMQTVKHAQHHENNKGQSGYQRDSRLAQYIEIFPRTVREVVQQTERAVDFYQQNIKSWHKDTNKIMPKLNKVLSLLSGIQKFSATARRESDFAKLHEPVSTVDNILRSLASDLTKEREEHENYEFKTVRQPNAKGPDGMPRGETVHYQRREKGSDVEWETYDSKQSGVSKL